MPYYWYNDKIDSHGNHEVHRSNCKYMPNLHNASYIGEFTYDFQAMQNARKLSWKKFDGCFFCMPTEHHG